MRFFTFIKTVEKPVYCSKAHVTLNTVKKNVSPYFDSEGNAHAPYINFDEDSYYEIIDILRDNDVLLEYDDDIRYGEYDLDDIEIDDLGDADAELVEKVFLMSSKKTKLYRFLERKDTTSQVNFAEKFTNEWRKRQRKFVSHLIIGIIPRVQNSQTQTFGSSILLNVLLFQKNLPSNGSMFQRLQSLINSQTQKMVWLFNSWTNIHISHAQNKSLHRCRLFLFFVTC